MTRAEFSKRTKIEAFAIAGGRCQCGCGSKLTPGEVEYDHRIPAAIGGSNDLNNCVVMRKKCHRQKTTDKDIPEISKSQRIAEKAMGLRKSRSGFRRPPPGHKYQWSRRDE